MFFTGNKEKNMNMKKLLRPILFAALSVCAALPAVAADKQTVLAFPGAEGGGRFVTGGRGCKVYHVTTLEDYGQGQSPIPGSFRAGLTSDTTIVFDVGGTIDMKQNFDLKGLKNITIAGQTAPGDGITFAGWTTNITNVDNIIIRYCRFRPGAKNVHKDSDGMDAFWGRPFKNAIVDHCSFSWSTDETTSPYRAENFTMQWCLISESLTMSGPSKGRHGYGAIWGGVNTTFHHNMIADHTSRNPRIGGGTFEKDDNSHIALLQISNNIIYDWGFNICYGGGRAQTNYINNWLEAGPGTRDDVAARVIDCGEKGKPGFFYVNGNVLAGNKEISADNSKGIYISDDSKPTTTIAAKPFESEAWAAGNLKVTSAQDAHDAIIASAGATLPRRDAYDARIVTEAKNGIGRFVNRDEEVGGYPCLSSAKRPDGFDTDSDGIPDDYEKANGLNPADAKDGALVAKNGYTNLENYLNQIGGGFTHEVINPTAEIINLQNNDELAEGTAVTVDVKASGRNPIAKIELFRNAEVVASIAPDASGITKISYTVPKAGSCFISAKVTDSEGNATQTTAVALHSIVPAEKANLGKWQQIDIGKPGIKGNAWLEGSKKKSIATVTGSGKLGRSEGAVEGTERSDATKDNFSFLYQTMKGDGSIMAKINSVVAVDNHAFAGLMIRDTLDQDSAAAAFGISCVKSTSYKLDGKTVYRDPSSVYLCGRDVKSGAFDFLGETLDWKDAAKAANIQLQDSIHFRNYDEEIGVYVKLERKGDTFTASYSDNGKKWTVVGKRTIKMGQDVYAGFAVDGNKAANKIDNLNTAKFSDIKFTE